MASLQTMRAVAFVLLGVAALVLKPYYHGPLAPIVHNYGGNVAASFAVYFWAVIAGSRLGFGRLAAAAAALLIVEAFEMTDGFWIMSNAYDLFDLVANAVGVGVALAVDRASAQWVAKRTAVKTVR